MRNSAWQPLSASMQSGTTLLRSSRLATSSWRILICTRARLGVEFGEARICAMEFSVVLTMSACLGAVALSSRLPTIDASQCSEITAQAWTHQELNILTKITTGTNRMIWCKTRNKRLHCSTSPKKTTKQREKGSDPVSSMDHGICATARSAKQMVTAEVAAALKFSQKATNGVHQCWWVTTVPEPSTQYSFLRMLSSMRSMRCLKTRKQS